MSLLLDALKRAEQEKLTRQVERPAAPDPVRAAPAANAAVLELQPMPGSAGSAGAAPRADAQAAQAVFKAKSSAVAKPDRRILYAAGGTIAVVALIAGVYFWHSLRTLSPRGLPAVAVRRIPPPAPIPTPGMAAAPASAGTAAQAAAPAPAPRVPTEAAASASPTANPRPAAPEARLEALLKEPQPAAAPAVELARTEEPKPRVAPAVEAGYEALLAGDLAGAREHYNAAIAADPTNLDAQLGLATVDARAGHVPMAAAAYRRALDLDPRNPTALAGLAALAATTRPEPLERTLRADLALHPESAALQLTLGNLYASQGRWAEAQAAYFEAQRLDPGNGDVAYNLAVSLDHLGQRRAAADFYRRALDARAGSAAQFDAAAASRRLAELAR